MQSPLFFVLRAAAFGAGLAFAATGAHAAAADAAAGGALARAWCAGCHVVGPDTAVAQSDVATFASIAARQGEVTAPWLAFRLLKPHPQMPSVSLSRDEAADLAAYFGTLRR